MGRWSLSLACALACIGCGPNTAASDDDSTGSSTTTSSDDDDASTRGSESPDTTADPTSATTSTSTSTTTPETDEDATTFDPPPDSCSDVDVERCADADVGQAGCGVHSGPGFRYDATTGACTVLGDYAVCLSGGVLPAPTTAWSVDESGVATIVQLKNMPFDLDVGAWSRCSCWHAGSPFACWACPATGSECGGGEPSCGGATTEEECAAAISDCAWVQTTVFAGAGDGCEPVSTGARCVEVLPGEADCALAVPPDECGEWTEPAPPYARPVEGGVEVITGVGCDAYPGGYMACWSAPGGDPAACSCPC